MSEFHIYLGVLLAGIASFLSPCVLPLVPPYLGYVSGATIADVREGQAFDPATWRRAVTGSLAFVLGFTSVFVALGAGASALGQAVLAYKPELSIAAGVVIVLFGLHFLGLLPIHLLYKDTRFRAYGHGGSPAGAYVLGLAFAFGWTPCVGPVLAALLAVAANTQSLAEGVRLLLVYSLGLGIPFVLAAIAIRPFLAFLERFKPYLMRVEQAMGVVLVVTGVLILSGSMNAFGNWLLDTFPGLMRVEDLLTPKGLDGEILKRGQGG